MGERPLLDRVFFQGKPATSASLARTLAAVHRARGLVPPNPGAMGAIGIAQLAAAELAKGNGNGGGAGDAARRRPPRDRPRAARPGPLPRRQDRRHQGPALRRPRLPQLCRLEVATDRPSASETRKIVSGGKCPKYDTVSAAGKAAQGRARPVPRARGAAGGTDREPRRCGRRRHSGRAERRPAVGPLPDRHAALLPRAADRPRLRGRGAARRPRHAGRRRPALLGGRLVRAGQAAPRPDRRGARRAVPPVFVNTELRQRRRRPLHVPDDAGRARHAGAGPASPRARRRGSSRRS